MNTLHILNGDGTAHPFSQSSIEGDYLVWRECMFEGPINQADSADFWRQRADFICRTYGSYGATHADYQEKVVDELQRLKEFRKYDAVVLWFEFDLFCQINLMFLLNRFSRELQNKPDPYPTIQLICIDHFPGVANFRGLGQLTSSLLASLAEQRRTLTADDLAFASRFWQAYINPDPLILQQFYHEQLAGNSTSSFPLLKKAVLAHFERFPFLSNGLNRIEQALLRAVEAGCSTIEQIMECFWASESIYGLGDSQIFNYLQPLMPDAIANTPKLDITEYGKALLQYKTDWLHTHTIDRWIGGLHLTSDRWRWDSKKNQLL